MVEIYNKFISIKLILKSAYIFNYFSFSLIVVYAFFSNEAYYFSVQELYVLGSLGIVPFWYIPMEPTKNNSCATRGIA